MLKFTSRWPLEPHGCRNYKFSFTLHPLHRDFCMCCDVEVKMIKHLNKKLLTPSSHLLYRLSAELLILSWSCLYYLTYFSLNFILPFLSYPFLFPAFNFSTRVALSVIFICHVGLFFPGFFFPFFNLLSLAFLSQVAVSGAADIRGWVPGNESEPDGAAEPTDGKGHRVVPETLGQDVPAGGREALWAGLILSAPLTDRKSVV